MAGNLYFPSKRIQAKTYIDYVDFESRKDWFLAFDFCQEYIVQKETPDGESYSCEEMCFCKLYRAKLLDAIFSLRIKRAWLLFWAGLKRMKLNKEVE